MIASLRMWLAAQVAGVSAMGLLAGRDGAVTGCGSPRSPPNSTAPAYWARRRHTLADELRILQSGCTSSPARSPGGRTRLRTYSRSVAAWQVNSHRPSCGIHRDYYPDQVLIDGGRAYLLDLDLHSEGDGALDVGNCVGHITEYALRSTETRGTSDARRCHRALCGTGGKQ